MISMRRPALLATLFCIGTDAFVPLQPSCARSACRVPVMHIIDGPTVVGIFFGSAALSAGLTTLVKRQGEHANERGLVSDEMRAYMAKAALGGAKRRHSERPTLPRRLSRGPVMAVDIDSSMVAGAGVFLGSAALGAGLIAFVENQGERTNERGVVSDEKKSRMGAGLQRYTRETQVATDYSSTIAQMEKAIATAEGREAIEGDGLTKKEKEALVSDGWGD